MSKDLLDFRLSYLRFLSRTWRDEKYLEYFKNNYGINGATDIYLLSGLNGEKDKKGVLNEGYGLKNNWNTQIQLQILEEGKPEWMPATRTWRGPNDKFIINIPIWDDNTIIDNPNIDNKQKVEALAAYYEKFPTMFGVLEEENQNKINRVQASPNMGLSSDLGIGDPGGFFAFGAIIQRVIAVAWSDKLFRAKLFNELSNMTNTEKDSGKDKDMSSLLSEYFGFNNPWNFDIIFVKKEIVLQRTDGAPKFIWQRGEEAENGKPGTPGNWDTTNGLPYNIIRLNYPPYPENEENLPLALNGYNCSGPEYPFTCV